MISDLLSSVQMVVALGGNVKLQLALSSSSFLVNWKVT